MIDFSFQVLRNSSSPSRRCRITSVPRSARVDRLDLELARAVARPAHALLGRQAGAARLDGDAVGDDEAGVEADAELADQVGVLLLVAFELGHELARAALGDRAQVRHRLLGAHADAVVADRSASWRQRRSSRGPSSSGASSYSAGVVQRLEAQLVAGVRRVGHQLAQEDLLVRVQRMGHQVQDLLAPRPGRRGFVFGSWSGRMEE